MLRVSAALAASLLVVACSKDDGDGGSTGGDTTTVADTETEDAEADGDSGDATDETTAETTADTGQGSMCDMCEQDCNEGDRCVPWTMDLDFLPDEARCFPVEDETVSLDEACDIVGYVGSGIDNCEVGDYCILDDIIMSTGYCHHLCCPNSADSGCRPNEICKPWFETAEDAAVVPLCMPTCDPLLPNDCSEQGRPGWACTQTGFDSGCGFVCAPHTPLITLGTQGDPCDSFTDCQTGLHCQVQTKVPGCTNELGCCTAYCDIMDPQDCDAAPGTECIAFECGDPQWANVGACVIPD